MNRIIDNNDLVMTWAQFMMIIVFMMALIFLGSYEAGQYAAELAITD